MTHKTFFILRIARTGTSPIIIEFCNMKAILIFVLLLSAYPVYSATFIVNTTADSNDAIPGDGVCLDAFAKCSLRAAIQTSNEQQTADTIGFSVPAPVSINLS